MIRSFEIIFSIVVCDGEEAKSTRARILSIAGAGATRVSSTWLKAIKPIRGVRDMTNFEKYVGTPEAFSRMVFSREDGNYKEMMGEFFSWVGVVEGREITDRFAEFLKSEAK